AAPTTSPSIPPRQATTGPPTTRASASASRRSTSASPASTTRRAGDSSTWAIPSTDRGASTWLVEASRSGAGDAQSVAGPSTKAPLGDPPLQSTFTLGPTWKNGGVGSAPGRGSPGRSTPSSAASTLVQPGPPVSIALIQSTSSGTPPVVSVLTFGT